VLRSTYGMRENVFQLEIVRMVRGFPVRVVRRLKRDARSLLRKAAAKLWTTYPSLQDEGNVQMRNRFAFMDSEFVRSLSQEFPDYPELVLAQTKQVLGHRFDLLGSGPVVVKRGMRCNGVENVLYPPHERVLPVGTTDWFALSINRSNRSESRRIGHLVDEAYTPIDWQLDFKSGFRWRENLWHGDIRFGHVSGVDVKVPWELARMQHLPTLAMAAHFSRLGLPNFCSCEVYASEFKNQVLDFIASNPPGFGVNWVCPMDIAIRVANWLVAKDIFAASQVVFSEDYECIFAASVKAHARHIFSNLEWAPQIRGNHYLANIAGLLFAAVYLPSCKEVDAWLAFSVQELITETHYQFHIDGSNFEASVCYHRLSSEIVLWAATFLANLDLNQKEALKNGRCQKWNGAQNLNNRSIAFHQVADGSQESPLPASVWERMRRMAEFSEAMTRPDGTVVQFGDNDSGRFMTLGSGEQLRAKNDPASPIWSLDQGALIAGINAVIGLSQKTPKLNLDVGAKILVAIAKPRLDNNQGSFLKESVQSSPSDSLVGDVAIWNHLSSRFVDTPKACRWISVFEANTDGILDSMELKAFKGMGCYIVRSPRLYLAIRCGEIGLAGLGAHAHCDQLAIELVIDGISKARDPGTYIYTPFPEKRNQYRSALAHHVPRVLNKEPANLNLGVFNLRGAPLGECLYFGQNGFIGRHAGYGELVYRIITLEKGRIVVKDFSENGLELADPTPMNLPFSQAYGRTMD